MRKLLSILTVLVLGMFLAASCGKQTAGPGKPPAEKPAPPVIAPEPVPEEPALTVVSTPDQQPLAAIGAAETVTPAGAAGTLNFTPIADATIHLYPEERKQSVGGRNYLRAKGGEDTGVLRFDLSSVKGRKVKRAALYLHLDNEKLRYLGLSTVTRPWNEGKSTTYAEEPGAAHYYSPVGADGSYWGADYTSDFYSVSFGLGGSFWYKTEVEPAGDRIVKAEVHPDLVYALVNGDADSLAVYDGSGQTRTNNSYFSREAGPDKAPRLEIETGDETDAEAPSAPGALVFSTEEMGNGELVLRFAPAADKGFGDRAFGYEAFWSEAPIADLGSAHKVDRIRVPHYPEADGSYLVFIQDLPAGKELYFAVRAYDRAGNRGPASAAKVVMPAYPLRTFLPADKLPSGKTAASPAVVTAGGVEIYALPGQVRIDPLTGDPLIPQPADPRLGNTVWDAPSKSVVLVSAREEVVDFQLSLKAEQGADAITVSLSDLAGPGTIPAATHVKVFTVWCVRGKEKFIPDVCVPVTGAFSIPIKGNDVPGQKAVAVWVDIYVPADAAPGTYKGTAAITAGGASAAIPVALTVVPVTLPGIPNHTVEVHTYSRSTNDGETVKRLGGAHKVETMIRQMARWNRCTVNILQYGHSGNFANDYSAPVMEGAGKEARLTDWSKFDAWYAPFFEGTAFTPANGYTGPGMGEPEALCYLPINEFWPGDLHTQYNFKTSVQETDRNKLPDLIQRDHGENAPPLEAAFTQLYQDSWDTVNAQFVEHLRNKPWDRTRLQFYLNNKINYHTTPNKGTWWILDEPSQMEDYFALAWFARKFRDVVDRVGMGDAVIEYRADVSRMRLLFGITDGAYDCFVSSGDVFDAAYLMRERRIRFPDEVHCRYGGGITMDRPIAELEASLVKNWIFGCDGSMPYYDCFWNRNWDNDFWGRSKDAPVDQHNIVYHPGPTGLEVPLASVRLKLARRAVQDMEYFYKLSAAGGWSRELVRRTVAASIDLKGAIQQKNYEDPGLITFEGIDMETLPRLRLRALATLAALGSDPQYIPPAGRTPSAPLIQGAWSSKPISWRRIEEAEQAAAEAARLHAEKIANAVTMAFKGRDGIADGGIFAAAPDQAGKGGSIRIEAAHNKPEHSGILVRCDLSKLPKDKEIFDATLVVKAWDCASRMPNKLSAYIITTEGWHPDQATFNNKADGQPWKNGAFAIGTDTEAAPAAEAVCPADAGSDTQEPPVRVVFDIKAALQRVLQGAPCFGFYVTGTPDRKVDDGYGVRTQVRTVDNGDGADGPEIIIIHER